MVEIHAVVTHESVSLLEAGESGWVVTFEVIIAESFDSTVFLNGMLVE